MMQLNSRLRRATDGYMHWCPACLEMHPLPDSWHFNGNMDQPTFQPSFRHGGIKTIKDKDGVWTGEWERDANGKGIPYVCHYILTDGILNFCQDCTHELAGKSVPLPDLPAFHRDGWHE